MEAEISMENRAFQKLLPEVENAIKAIASNINAGDAIIFCGAGISRDSGFPVVNEFIPYVLLTLCADSKEIPTIEASLKTIADAQQRQDKMKQIIAKKIEVSPQVIDKIINNLPFEAFIEILRGNSKIDKIFEIYNPEAYKPNVEPNTNHMMLAKLVVTGKVRTIVTTNFDQLIEKALRQLDKQAGLDYDVVYREEDFERVDWAADRCRLIKIHGSIDDKQAMAITLSQVARQELSAARAGIIRHVFSQGDHKTVLILGYSCSDVFDLSPQIEALAENFKQVCLIQHSDRPKIEDIREQEQKNPFKAFGNSIRLFIHTSDLVETLWKATLQEPYEDHKALKTTPDWKAKVQAWYVDSVQTGSEAIRDGISGLIFDAICEWRVAIGRYERVLAHATEHVDDRLEGSTLGNMGNAYIKLGEYRKAIEFFEQALEIHRRIGDVKDEGNILGSMGAAYEDLGEYRKAIELYEQGLEIARRIGDVQGEGIAFGSIGNAHRNLGEYRNAIELYEQHLEITRRIGDVQGEGSVLGNMGIAYADLGEYRKAIELYEQVLKKHRYIGDAQGEGNALGNMGNTYLYLGEYRKAIEFHEQHLEIARRIGHVRGEGNALGNIGLAYAALGEYRKAIEFFEQHLEIARHIEDVRGEGGALGNIGLAYADLGEYRKAIEFFEQHLEIARRIGDVQGEGNALGNMGVAYTALGEYRKAIEFFEQRLETARRIGDIRGEGSDLGNMGIVYANLGEYCKAIEFFEQHLEIARRIGDVWGEGSALANIGRAYASIGDKEKAAQAFTQGKAIFASLGLPHMVNTIDNTMKQVGL
jgi:tetratricopeptide (TPR) repeat protein